MIYTVKQVAKIAGISVRTLHYYDEYGLLKPSFVRENGYRIYEEKQLFILQQILFFRELEFPLEDIARIMHSPGYDVRQTLADHKRMLEIKKERIEKLLKAVAKTIKSMEGGDNMKNDDIFASFDDRQMMEYQEEAKKRWGKTKAWEQSRERTKNWTKKDYDQIKKQGEEFTKELARAMDLDIKSPQVQELIDKHHKGIEVFYDCPPEAYRMLGNMYVEDKRFTAFYDKFRPGLAKFVRDAINYYCDLRKGK